MEGARSKVDTLNLAPLSLHLRDTQLHGVQRVLSSMQVTRHIFDTALGKVLMPWVTLGFGAALLTLATEVIEVVRDFRW